MKGVTRFECCSCWPEMIDRGALLAGTDLPLPVVLPPKQGPDNWKNRFDIFLRNEMVIFHFSCGIFDSFRLRVLE